MIEWLFAFVLVILARLPYLLSDHVYFDGDEAMVGIMGRDLITGRNLPIYFYGQQYGFSFFEALAAGFFILFLGSGLASLKLGGMLIFSLGIQRYLKIFRTKGLPLLPFMLMAGILCLFPTWQVWGTKLRGGYLTAFVGVAFVAEQLLLYDKWELKNWIKVAGISALILVAQPIFLIIVLPLLVFRLIKIERKHIVPTFGLGLVALVLLRIPVFLNNFVWTPVGLGKFNLDGFTHYFINGFWSVFTGFYAYSDIYEVPTLVKIGSALFLLLTVLALILMIAKGSKPLRIQVLLLLLGMVLSLVPSVALGIGGGRYLLPFFTGVLLLLVWFAAGQLVEIKPTTRMILFISMFAALIPTTMRYKQFVSFWLEAHLNDMQVLNELKSELEKRNISHAFASEWQVFWQLNYLGNEEMSFRYLSMEDRVQRFIDQTNECYLDTTCSTALVGSLWPLNDMQTVSEWESRMERINDRFYIMENPEDIFLETGGFELPAK